MDPASVVKGEIEFVGKGNPDPARFIKIPKDVAITNELGPFIDQFLFTQFGLKKPKVLLSVTGGAQDFKMLSSKLEQVFNRGIVRAAENTTAWIITGGLDAGVMRFVGDAIKNQDFEEVPCIGIATFKKVSHSESLLTGEKVYYSATKLDDDASAALNPNHTHFILVDSPVEKWGEEIPVRTALEDYISNVWQVPLVLIVVNGGPGTISTVAEGAAKNFPVIIVEGSGRAADAIAEMIKAANGQKGSLNSWNALTAKSDPKAVDAWTKKIIQAKDQITLFNPNEDATSDMDLVILRAILNGSRKSDTFRNKLFLGVEWGRPDVIRELLEKDDESETSDTKREAINHALQMALELDRPEIFSLLTEKGADKAKIDLKRLWRMESVKYLVARLLPYSGVNRNTLDSELSTLNSFADVAMAAHTGNVDTEIGTGASTQLDTAKKVLKRIHPMYYKLLVDGKASYTDMLVWAIMVNRHDLAKQIWTNTVLPIHTALVATHIYNTLAEWFQGDEDYPKNAEWFEGQAVKVLDKMDYEVAKKVLTWQWTELESKSPLQIAEIASCKQFMSHQYVQRHLDEVLYSDVHGELLVGTSALTILWSLALPFFSPYKHRSGKNSKFYHIYDLPIVKFWSSTVVYVAFLAWCGAVLIYSGDLDNSWVEFILWAWIIAIVIEEFGQYLEDRESYFDHISNQMDALMILLFLAYIGVRIATYANETSALKTVGTDILIFAVLIAYARLLNVFAFSQQLGPLFFVIVRLIKDVAKWTFIFVVFMVSFQLAIMAVTYQAEGGDSMWKPYPDGTFAVAYFTIIGDFSYAMPTMAKTRIGVIVLAVYALIAQIMLVNLLIAMMGDTYSEVKDNSDKEWKFYRYSLVCDYCTCSPIPPPFNLILGPIQYIYGKFFAPVEVRVTPDSQPYQLVSTQEPVASIAKADLDDVTIKKLKIAKERILEKDEEEELNSVKVLSSNIREHLRLMSNQREGDRLYVEQSLKSMQDLLLQMSNKINELSARPH